MKTHNVVILTSLFWILGLSSCASTLSVKTWIITDQGLEHNANGIQEMQAFAASIGYSCYSELDDTAWRQRMANLSVCCSTGGQGVSSMVQP